MIRDIRARLQKLGDVPMVEHSKRWERLDKEVIDPPERLTRDREVELADPERDRPDGEDADARDNDPR